MKKWALIILAFLCASCASAPVIDEGRIEQGMDATSLLEYILQMSTDPEIINIIVRDDYDFPIPPIERENDGH